MKPRAAHRDLAAPQPGDLATGLHPWREPVIAALLVACAVGHVIATRLSWADIPLQTDTGMWAYIGSRILDGALPYRDLWESKPPGIYYTFAAVEWIFGVGGHQALLWLDAALSLAVFALTYAVARRFASRVSAAVAVLLLSFVFCHRVLADWGDNVEKFVALFEMAACILVLHATGRPKASWAWLAAGISCGLAALFKQTGVLFLATILAAVLLGWMRNRKATGSVARPAALLAAGALIPWLAVLGYMSTVGMLGGFWHQVVCYDLVRVGSSNVERSRLLESSHWSHVAGTLKLAAALLAPAIVAACCWLRRRQHHDRLTHATPAQASDPSLPGWIVAYPLLVIAMFLIAPYGYGHYLLQAAPPAAVLTAWVLDRRTPRTRRSRWSHIAIATVILGLWPMRDHFRFTFDSAYQFRTVYQRIGEDVFARVRAIEQNTGPTESVMLWPPDYAVSYYARRTTPLEMSNSDVIFKGKIGRLSPPMPDLLAHLQTQPPAVIMDATILDIHRVPASRPGTRLGIKLQRGVSLLEAPDDQHETLEGRLLAPLKRWVQAHYGGQVLIGRDLFCYHGGRWRSWQDLLSPDAD